jgi:glutamyl-tRNA synthetase
VYIRELATDDLARRTKPFLERALARPVDEKLLLRVIPLVRERIKLLSEIVEMADFFFVEDELHYEPSSLLGKRYAGDPAGAAAALDAVIARLQNLNRWDHESLEGTLRPQAEELGVKAGDLFGIIRVAVTGKTAAPPLFETLEVLGRERTLARLQTARNKLAGSNAAATAH